MGRNFQKALDEILLKELRFQFKSKSIILSLLSIGLDSEIKETGHFCLSYLQFQSAETLLIICTQRKWQDERMDGWGRRGKSPTAWKPSMKRTIMKAGLSWSSPTTWSLSGLPQSALFLTGTWSDFFSLPRNTHIFISTNKGSEWFPIKHNQEVVFFILRNVTNQTVTKGWRYDMIWWFGYHLALATLNLT